MSKTQFSHQREVGAETMIVITRLLRHVAVRHVSWNECETIPDGFAAAVKNNGAFDLRGGGGHSPDEVRRKRIGEDRPTHGRLASSAWMNRLADGERWIRGTRMTGL